MDMEIEEQEVCRFIREVIIAEYYQDLPSGFSKKSTISPFPSPQPLPTTRAETIIAIGNTSTVSTSFDGAGDFHLYTDAFDKSSW